MPLYRLSLRSYRYEDPSDGVNITQSKKECITAANTWFTLVRKLTDRGILADETASMNSLTSLSQQSFLRRFAALLSLRSV
jgi:hypothetical protein